MPTGSASDARAILVANPQMAASSFFNQLVAAGILTEESAPVVNQTPATPSWVEWAKQSRAKPKQETDSVSSAPRSMFVGPYEKAKLLGKHLTGKTKAKESAAPSTQVRCRFVEQDYQPDLEVVGPSKFRTVLIEEGLGNFRDRFYYTKEALQSAIPLFDGAKIFADHPTMTEEQERPERSVRDMLGHFEQTAYVESDDNRARIEADCYVLPDESYRWARALMREAVQYRDKYPDRNFIGLSINAGGDAETASIDEVISWAPASAQQKLLQAKAQGIDSVRLVKKIESVVSCDLVSEPGAGGRIMQILNAKRG